MKTEVVLFDFDMTLVDSVGGITVGMNALADAKELERVSQKDVLQAQGMTMPDIWRTYWGDIVEEDWMEYYLAHFAELEKEHYELLPGCREMLETLRVHGIRIGVVTNRFSAKDALETVDLCALIDVAVGLEDGVEPKPSPEPLLRALDRLGADRTTAVYVGDTDIDMQAAAAAGIPGIGVITGSVDRERLIAAGAWRTTTDLREIPALIGVVGAVAT